MSLPTALCKSKKTTNCFVFKRPTSGSRLTGRRETPNMVRVRRTHRSLPEDLFRLAIYLMKRTLRNRQRHGLEEHEVVR